MAILLGGRAGELVELGDVRLAGCESDMRDAKAMAERLAGDGADDLIEKTLARVVDVLGARRVSCAVWLMSLSAGASYSSRTSTQRSIKRSNAARRKLRQRSYQREGRARQSSGTSVIKETSLTSMPSMDAHLTLIPSTLPPDILRE